MSAPPELELRRARLAQNQSVFREVNERIEDFARGLPNVAFICECARSECSMCVSMTVEEYERVRADGSQFLVVPGHQAPEVEETLERHDGYLIVSKLGYGAAVSARLDPRVDE